MAPSARRRWNASPLAAETSAKACDAPGASELRIMTPAFDQALTLVIESIRAITSTSPLTC